MKLKLMFTKIMVIKHRTISDNKKKQLKQLTENFMEVNGKKHTNKNGASYLYLRYGFLGAALSCSKVLPIYSVLLGAAAL